MAPSRAEDRPAPPPIDRSGAPAPPELTPDVQELIQSGLRFLAKEQRTMGPLRGSWEGGEYQIAVTSLAGLALLASGSTPTSGEHAENISEAIAFLLKCQAKSGIFRLGLDSRPMYGHGFATLFLAECYGMGVGPGTDRQLREALHAAVAAISQSQSRDGGWYYTPGSPDDEGSVTITQIQALRAARNAGIKVDRRTIDRALDYIRHSQEPDGGIRYTAKYGRSSLALTAAGLAVLFGAGDYESEHVRRALDYVRLHMDTGSQSSHFHYTHFYAAQALFQQGGSDWDVYFPKIRQELVHTASHRETKTYWRSGYGECYGTALSLLILEIPFRYLPIYER